MCCVWPDRLSVSEASVPQTAAPLHPHCLIQTGSTLLSGALSVEETHYNLLCVSIRTEMICNWIRRTTSLLQYGFHPSVAPPCGECLSYLWRGPTMAGTTYSSWTTPCLSGSLHGKTREGFFSRPRGAVSVGQINELIRFNGALRSQGKT